MKGTGSMTGPRPYLILRIVGLVVWVLSVVRVWVEVRLFWRRTLVLLRGVLLPLMPVRSLLLGRHSVVLLLRHLPALETGGHVTFDNSRVALQSCCCCCFIAGVESMPS